MLKQPQTLSISGRRRSNFITSLVSFVSRFVLFSIQLFWETQVSLNWPQLKLNEPLNEKNRCLEQSVPGASYYSLPDLCCHCFSSCSTADRIVLDSNTTLLNQTAILVSQKYNRSRDWYTKCLKFRYMLRGPGRKSVTIYQQTGNYREVPIWIWKTRTGNNWVYGQVPLSAVSTFQVKSKRDTPKYSTTHCYFA